MARDRPTLRGHLRAGMAPLDEPAERTRTGTEARTGADGPATGDDAATRPFPHEVVAPDGDDDEQVAHPGRVVRLAYMAQSLLHQLEGLELDAAARHRVAALFNETLDVLRELLSEELRDELDRLALRLPADPTTAELRVAHAQLVGWLDGLFHGIRTTLIAHQLATQEELARTRQQRLEAARADQEMRAAGHYL